MRIPAAAPCAMPILWVAILSTAASNLARARGEDGGRIEGRLTDESTGQGIKRVRVRAYAHGRAVAASVLSEGDGSYVLRDLPAGRYAVCAAAGDEYRPAVAADVEVGAGAATRLDLKARRSLVIEGDSWVQSYPAFAQSFQATGLGLTAVGIKAFGGAKRVGIQVRRGDGNRGEVCGPSRRTEAVGGEGSAFVRWSGTEVATIPGAVYTLEFAAPEGQTWTPGVAGRGDVYAGGRAWFAGVPRPHSDLGIVLCEDNDGLRTHYGLSGAEREHRVVSAGQTFVAAARNVTLASAVLADVGTAPTVVRFSLHEGGPGGTQIGPSKVTGPESDVLVAWGPEEVPTTPGETYYLHIESLSGDPFLAARQGDAYGEGHAVLNGRPEPGYDIAAVLAGEMSPEDFQRLVAHPRRVEIVPLRNASFEDGAGGWAREGEGGAVVGVDGGVVPMWGSRMFGWTHDKEGEHTRPTIYQQVAVEPGRWYAFSGSVYTDHAGGRSSDVKVRLVALPAGGTAVRDDQRIQTSQWYATEGRWCRGSVEFRAEADAVTVGFELEQRFNLDTSTLYVDGALLERIGGAGNSVAP